MKMQYKQMTVMYQMHYLCTVDSISQKNSKFKMAATSNRTNLLIKSVARTKNNPEFFLY